MVKPLQTNFILVHASINHRETKISFFYYSQSAQKKNVKQLLFSLLIAWDEWVTRLKKNSIWQHYEKELICTYITHRQCLWTISINCHPINYHKNNFFFVIWHSYILWEITMAFEKREKERIFIPSNNSSIYFDGVPSCQLSCRNNNSHSGENCASF